MDWSIILHNILAVIGIAILVVLMIVMLSNEKYRKYSVVLIPFIAFLVLYIFKRKSSDQTDTANKTDFQAKLDDVKADIKEINTVAQLKSKYADEQKQEELKKLDEITQMDDKTERRQRLAELVG